MLDVISKLGEEVEDFLDGVSGLARGRELNERFNHWSIDVEFSQVSQGLNFFSDLFNFTFKLDPTSTHLKIVNNSEGFRKSIDGLLMFGLADSVVGSLLGSECSTVFDSLSKEGDVIDGLGKFRLSSSEEFLSVGNSSFALSLSGSMGISLISGVSNFSVTDDQVFIMLGISLSLFGLFRGNKFINKIDDIINDSFRSKMNL